MPEPVTAHLAWLRMRGLTPVTVYERSRALARMRAALPVPLLDATEDDLAAWREGLTRLSDYAIAAYTGHAQCFYRWAVDEGLIKASPAEKLPVPRRPRRIPRPVAEEDLMAALASAPPRIRPWLVLAAWCGLRAREIAYLKREDIMDHARPPVLLVSEQAAKGGRERMIPLSAFVLAELAAARLPSHGWAFVRHDGSSGPNAPWLVSRLANDVLHEAGVPATLHMLRHRYGSQIYSATHDLRLTQELLGHQSPATTAGYAAWDRVSAAKAAESLPVPPELCEFIERELFWLGSKTPGHICQGWLQVVRDPAQPSRVIMSPADRDVAVTAGQASPAIIARTIRRAASMVVVNVCVLDGHHVTAQVTTAALRIPQSRDYIPDMRPMTFPCGSLAFLFAVLLPVLPLPVTCPGAGFFWVHLVPSAIWIGGDIFTLRFGMCRPAGLARSITQPHMTLIATLSAA